MSPAIHNAVGVVSRREPDSDRTAKINFNLTLFPIKIGSCCSRASSIELPILRLLARLSKGCARVVWKGCRCDMEDVRELPDYVEVAADGSREKIFFVSCVRAWKNCLSTCVPNASRIFARKFAAIIAFGKFACAVCASFKWCLREENAHKLPGGPTFRSPSCGISRRRVRLWHRRRRRSAQRLRRGPATAHIA